MEGIKLGCIVELYNKEGLLVGREHFDNSVPEIELVKLCFNLNFGSFTAKVWQRYPKEHTTEYYYETFFKMYADQF